MDTITTFQHALKEYYSPDVVMALQFKKQPFFAMVKKDNNFVGVDYYRIPIEIGSPQGTSHTWATAAKNGLATSMTVNEFKVARTTTHQIGYIAADVLLAAADKVGAFLDVATRQVDTNMLALSRDIGICMYRDGWGARGRIAVGSAVNGLTLQLSTVSDAHNFEYGMRLDVVLTANYGGNAGTQAAEAHGSSTNALIVTGINHDTGVLTFGANVNDAVNGIPSIAHSAYLFLEGDVVGDAPATGPVTKIAGLAGWLPNTAPTAGYTWFGCNRSIDSRLYGLRYDASAGIPIVEAMNKSAQLVTMFGGTASHMFCSFNTFGDIINALETKVRYIDARDGEIGFKGVEVITPAGIIEVFPDINCPDTNAYMLELDSWKLCSLKDPIVGFGYTGGTSIDLQPYYNGDGYQLRLANRGGLGCRAPSHNCNIILA